MLFLLYKRIFIFYSTFILITLAAFSIAISATPTSANIASHIVANPTTPNNRIILNDPVKIIGITDVATREEIDNALRERREKRQHVVPVARTQIQRNFAGKLVSQLKDLFKSKDRDDGRTIVKPPFSFRTTGPRTRRSATFTRWGPSATSFRWCASRTGRPRSWSRA